MSGRLSHSGETDGSCDLVGVSQHSLTLSLSQPVTTPVHTCQAWDC